MNDIFFKKKYILSLLSESINFEFNPATLNDDSHTFLNNHQNSFNYLKVTKLVNLFMSKTFDKKAGVLLEGEQNSQNNLVSMKKGVINMIRIQTDKSVAMPTDTRLQILALSKDIIHS